MEPQSSLPKYLEKILLAYEASDKKLLAEGALPTLRVSQAFSSLALVYEKIRTAVDFSGEHLFRRLATERILRRLLMNNRLESEAVAKNLLKELIWGRYLPNEKIPLAKIAPLTAIIDKYSKLKRKTSLPKKVFDHPDDFILGLLSTEIDELIVDQTDDEAWAISVSEWFWENFDWIDPISEEQQRLLIYVAVRRAMLKSDEAIISYHLFCRAFPNWTRNEDLNRVADNFKLWQKSVKSLFLHPYSNTLFRFIQKRTPAFLVLRSLIEENRERLNEIIKDPKIFEEKIIDLCNRRYSQIGKKVRRGIIRSIIYIFATKMLFAFFLEVPFELFRHGKLSLVPLSINLVFPPFLMGIVGLLIHPPNEENTQRIIRTLKAFTFTDLRTTRFIFSLKPQDKKLSHYIFRSVYILIFLLIFFFASLALWRLNFNLISAGIFFFFVSLVLLFGFRVRWSAQELRVTPEKESFPEFIFNLIAMPFLDLGVKLSVGLTKLNVLMFVLDFLIEAPLKSIINVIGEWVTFIQRKREEVIEVPF